MTLCLEGWPQAAGASLPIVTKSHRYPDCGSSWPMTLLGRCTNAQNPRVGQLWGATHSRAPPWDQVRPLTLCPVSSQTPLLFPRLSHASPWEHIFLCIFWWWILISWSAFWGPRPKTGRPSFSETDFVHYNRNFTNYWSGQSDMFWLCMCVCVSCVCVSTAFALKWPCLEYFIFGIQPNTNLLRKYLFWMRPNLIHLNPKILINWGHWNDNFFP